MPLVQGAPVGLRTPRRGAYAVRPVTDAAPAPRPRRSPLKKAGFAAVAVGLCLLLAEGVLRLAGYPTGLERSFSGLWEQDPTALAAQPGLFRAGKRRVGFPPELAYDVTINSLGLRGPEPASREGGLLVLGDSVTFGYHVADEATLPARLAARLGRGDVLNAGCGHFTITDQRRWLEEKLLALRPRAVLLQFCANDVLDAELLRSPTLYEKLLEARTTLGDRLRETALGEVQLRAAIALKRTRPPAEGLSELPDVPQASWDRYGQELAGLAALLRERKVPLVVLAFPDLAAARATGPSPYDGHLAALCKSANIPFRSALAAYRARAGGPDPLYLWPLDPHPSAAGLDLLAAEAQALLTESGALSRP